MPSRDIHEGPASYSLISQLLTLAANAIALCQGAHLGSLKLYNKKFLRLCFTKYEASSNLRDPTVMEAQAADKRCWELISDLVNQHSWKLDDALHELSEVRSDMSSLLAPRPFINKKLLETQDTWRPRLTGLTRGGKGAGKGGKGRGNQHDKPDRMERGGKGGKGKEGKPPSAPGKWLCRAQSRRHRLRGQSPSVSTCCCCPALGHPLRRTAERRRRGHGCSALCTSSTVRFPWSHFGTFDGAILSISGCVGHLPRQP